MKKIRLAIGADIVPGEQNIADFASGNVEALLGGELTELLGQMDFSAFNLETPLSDVESPIRKAGPNHRVPEAAIKGIQKISPYFLTLANNHIMDQGEQGLAVTEKLLDQNNIAHAGTGKSLQDASRPYITEVEGIRVGIYCCAEHEFSIAGEDTAGANPYDPLESFDAVYALKQQTDYVIVLYHGGREFYRYPTPELQRVFHKFADKGADLVIAQHTHCIGCREKYHGAELVYGQGNFHFTADHNEYTDSSLLIEVSLEKEGNTNEIPTLKSSPVKREIQYHVVDASGDNIRLANETLKNNVLHGFQLRSTEIEEPVFVSRHFEEYAKTQGSTYSKVLHGKYSFLERVYLHFVKHSFEYFYRGHVGDNRRIDSLIDFMSCETHKEITLAEARRVAKKMK